MLPTGLLVGFISGVVATFFFDNVIGWGAGAFVGLTTSAAIAPAKNKRIASLSICSPVILAELFFIADMLIHPDPSKLSPQEIISRNRYMIVDVAKAIGALSSICFWFCCTRWINSKRSLP